MNSTRRTVIVANPERDQLVDDAAAALSSLDPTLIEPDSADDIADTVGQAISDGADTVVAVGGDGTQRSVAEAVVGTDACQGIVAGGTVNLLAQVLGVDQLDAAVQAIEHGRRRSIDVGRCNGRLFLINASFGFDAAVIEETNKGHKERWGKFSFVRSSAVAYRRSRARHVTVTADGSTIFEGSAMSVIVTNVAERSSADVVIAPDGAIDDGKLDILIVRADTVWSSLRVLFTLGRSREPRPDDVVRGQAASFDIEWERPVPGQEDGDAIAKSARYEIRTDAGVLDVMVPNDTAA